MFQKADPDQMLSSGTTFVRIEGASRYHHSTHYDIRKRRRFSRKKPDQPGPTPQVVSTGRRSAHLLLVNGQRDDVWPAGFAGLPVVIVEIDALSQGPVGLHGDLLALAKATVCP